MDIRYRHEWKHEIRYADLLAIRQRPEGEEGFQPSENGEGFAPPEGEFGPPEMTQDASATAETDSAGTSASTETQSESGENTMPEPSNAGSGREGNLFDREQTADNASEQTETADSTTAWILVLGSAACLALGLTIALIYKRRQHIDV